MLSICRILAKVGYEVRTLCTTAFDTPGQNARKWHESLGLKIVENKPCECTLPVWTFEADSILHNLMDTPGQHTNGWEGRHGGDFEKALDAILDGFVPDATLTYAGMPCFVNCRRKIRKKGGVVVLGLRNHGYFSKNAMTEVDYGLASSNWLAGRYASFFGRNIEGLPSPLVEKDIIPDKSEQIFYTFVNPATHKGALFFIRMAEELSLARPDIPLLILDSQDLGAKLVSLGIQHGIDLRRHANIMLAPKVPKPRDYMHVTRAVLVPSLWEEPSGRVAAEAQLCGIPAIVSDRGGLPETVGEAGIVLHIDNAIRAETRQLPPAEAVREWIDMIVRMTDDEAFYRQSCANAMRAGERYKESVIGPQYVAYFDSLRPARE